MDPGGGPFDTCAHCQTVVPCTVKTIPKEFAMLMSAVAPVPCPAPPPHAAGGRRGRLAWGDAGTGRCGDLMVVWLERPQQERSANGTLISARGDLAYALEAQRP